MTTYCFDLDGTLCSKTDGKYNEAEPFVDRIAIVNKLYDEGHKIIIETARGSSTKKNWYSVTENQLKTWGVKYHILRTGQKIEADIYIDDKSINSNVYFK